MTMTLKSPFIITPRLLPGVHIGKAFISIEYDGGTSDGRIRYRYHIDLPDGSEHTGNDLKSGVGSGNLQSGMESLLSFLAACGESYGFSKRTGREGENTDLFPPAVAEWAYQNSDELATLEIEIQETENLIDEG